MDNEDKKTIDDLEKQERLAKARREFEEGQRWHAEFRKKRAEEARKADEKREKELREMGIEMYKHDPSFPSGIHGYCDAPGTMDNGTATFFWVVSLVVGAIFKGNWVIWIISTLIWINHITRHSR